jgi:hypothetical protein
MSLDGPPNDKMMNAAPVKKGFHFSGDGIWHNLSIEAENIQEATREWLARRRLINPFEQSTPTQKEDPKSELQ